MTDNPNKTNETEELTPELETALQRFGGVGGGNPPKTPPKQPVVMDRYPRGYKVKNKQTSVYLDIDVIDAIQKEAEMTGRPKSHFINELLVEYFKLQQRSNGIILED